MQQIDGNIICPRILGETIGLNGFWIIFAIVVFGALFGFVGMIIGVPTFAMLYTWLKRWISRRLGKRNMPDDTLAYSVPGVYREMTDEEKARTEKQDKKKRKKKLPKKQQKER